MDPRITIAQLTPATRGAHLLRFEVAEVEPISNKPDQISCKVVDESGCINAYFNNHGKHIKEGFVYQLQGLRCKVVDHHLRLEMKNDSKLARVKYDMNFKDLFNNLSQKFFVSKAEQGAIQGKSIVKEEKKTEQQVRKEKEKSQQQKKDKSSEFLKKQNSKIDTLKPQPQLKSENRQKKDSKIQNQKKESKFSRENTERKDKKYEQKEEEKQKKTKYTEKKPQSKWNASQQPKDGDSKHRVVLKDLHLHWQKEVNLFVQVHTKSAIHSNKYILVRACDSSGSTYIELDRRAHLEDRAWYCLRRFRVFGDKKYGYIASQQEYSTLDMLDDYNQIPENKPIYYPKPK